jgi:urease
MDLGRQILGRRHVRPGVEYTLYEVQVEGTFPDGTKLVTVHQPIASDSVDLATALMGSGLPVPSDEIFPPITYLTPDQAPGAIIVDNAAGDIVLNKGRKCIRLKVTNDGDRAIQVGSHYHFIETNRKLCFDRQLAYGMRLNIPAGTAVRFEPGETKIVVLCEIAGNRYISGGNNLATGPVDQKNLVNILETVTQSGFTHEKLVETLSAPGPCKMSRHAYRAAYGPTKGDRIRLGDTELWAEIERDYTVYGDECVFGGGKVLREGMGQCTRKPFSECLDLVITNATIIDYTGIYKVHTHFQV